MIDNRTVGKTIAALRQAKGMTQQQLAAALNVSHQAVSKWENGAALPDIQTLVELTQLFGITVEQLLSGEIPEARMEDGTTLDERISNIGNFFSGVIDDIGNVFRSEPENVPEEMPDDGAVEAKVGESEDSAPEEDPIDLQKLLQMAPFMSKGAVEEMLSKSRRKLSATEIARFAPFVDSAFLEKLIRTNESEITWDTLRRIAPFLKKEVVDAFARTIALGEKYVRPASEEVERATENVCRTFDDVSQKIGRGVDKAVRKVVRLGENVATGVSRAFDGLTGEAAAREERLAKLRRSAFERALEDGRWEWIEAHIAEVEDEELKQMISERANKLGMQDWVCKHLGGYANVQAVDQAIEEGNWGWLGEHAWKFDAAMQQRVALAAMRAENWQWLSGYAEQLQISDCVLEIAICARKAGARMLAVQLTRYDMKPEQVEQMALEAVGAGDMEFFEMICELLGPEALCRCCIRMAKAGKWEDVREFAQKLDERGIEWLMEVAIEAGNFDAIDMLDGLLKAESKEGEEQ